MIEDPANIARRKRRRITTKPVVTVSIFAVIAYASISSCTGDDTGPITYDSCAEADAEAAEWQRMSVDAEADMYAYATTPDNRYDDARAAFDKAMLMQSRIIAGNQACFPAMIVMQAASHIGVPLAELPVGPSQ